MPNACSKIWCEQNRKRMRKRINATDIFEQFIENHLEKSTIYQNGRIWIMETGNGLQQRQAGMLHDAAFDKEVEALHELTKATLGLHLRC